MNYNPKQILPFNIIGIAIKTTNQNQQAQHNIGALWQRVYAENLIAQIHNRLDDEVLVIYTAYEGDYTKPYTCIIGCRVIPAANYEVFTAKGQLPESIIQTWQEIWRSDIKRAYSIDFEIYGSKAHDPNNSEVEIYIGTQI